MNRLFSHCSRCLYIASDTDRLTDAETSQISQTLSSRNLLETKSLIQDIAHLKSLCDRRYSTFELEP